MLSSTLASLLPLAAFLLVPSSSFLPTTGSRSFNLARAQDGSATAGSTPADAISSYKCDPNSCKLPNCRCVRPTLAAFTLNNPLIATPATLDGPPYRSTSPDALFNLNHPLISMVTLSYIYIILLFLYRLVPMPQVDSRRYVVIAQRCFRRKHVD